jgi:hypothetical protein
LLDYHQRTPEKASMLIVLEVKPNSIDQKLAISNGFGIAYPSKREFLVIWPERYVPNQSLKRDAAKGRRAP